MASGRGLIVPLILMWLVGCAAPERVSTSVPARLVSHTSDTKSIYLVRHGWHSGLVIRRSDITQVSLPEISPIGDVNFVEFGWGDAAYLKSRFPNPIVLANAACLPSRSGIHVAGFQERPEEFFKDSQIIEISLSAQQIGQLCRFISDDFKRDQNGDLERLGPAIYGTGGIYPSKSYYFLPNTCNVWAARGLAAADCPVIVPLCSVAQPLVMQTKAFGQEVHNGSSILPVMYPFVNFDRPTGE